MCTAIKAAFGNYFGRTLDLEYHYDEEVCITPRAYRFDLVHEGEFRTRYAIIGMATVVRDYPLYYDAMNERGLCMAGLNFLASAHFGKRKGDKTNIAAHELIPYILGSCADLFEARARLLGINLTDDEFDTRLGGAHLHWMVADKSGAITFEITQSGARIYENKVGVLTNEPSFDFHMRNLAGYMHLSPSDPVNTFCEGIKLERYSKGMGAIGLPGDVSSASRFVRAAFNNLNSVCENDGVGQFFHVLSSVEQIRGADRTKDGFEITHYTSCCDMDSVVYYYTTYSNRQINAVDMKKEDLDAADLIAYPLTNSESICWQN